MRASIFGPDRATRVELAPWTLGRKPGDDMNDNRETIGYFCDGVQHIGIPVRNLRCSEDFYRGLGFQTEYGHEMKHKGHELSVAFMRLGNLLLELYQFAAEPPVGKPGAVDHFAVNCQNIEAAFALAQSQGYEIAEPGLQSLPFYESGVRFFIIIGPDGEKIEINQRE